MKLIDADEVLNKLPDDLPYKASVRRVLMQAKNVDVVEVVRCKDCKHCDHCYPAKPKDGDAVEGWYCNLSKGWRKPDDFCSCGERVNYESSKTESK